MVPRNIDVEHGGSSEKKLLLKSSKFLHFAKSEPSPSRSEQAVAAHTTGEEEDNVMYDLSFTKTMLEGDLYKKNAKRDNDDLSTLTSQGSH